MAVYVFAFVKSNALEFCFFFLNEMLIVGRRHHRL